MINIEEETYLNKISNASDSDVSENLCHNIDLIAIRYNIQFEIPFPPQLFNLGRHSHPK